MILPGLTAGATDPADRLPELLQRLENAGVNKIIEEKQAQVDAWRAANS